MAITAKKALLDLKLSNEKTGDRNAESKKPPKPTQSAMTNRDLGLTESRKEVTKISKGHDGELHISPIQSSLVSPLMKWKLN